MADFNTSNNALFVATYSEDAVKRYALAKVEYDQSAGIYYHENCGSFFEEDSVRKYFTVERGYEWTGGDVFDDFC